MCIFLWGFFGFQHSLLARPRTKKLINLHLGSTFEESFYPFLYFLSQCIIFLMIYDVVRHLTPTVTLFEFTSSGKIIIYWLNRAANVFLIVTVFHFDIGRFTGISQLFDFFMLRSQRHKAILVSPVFNSSYL